VNGAEKNTLPVVEVIRVARRRDNIPAVVVTVRCPLCSRTHVHGAALAELDAPGDRRSHCHRGPYLLPPIDPAQVGR
jgi:hypothetical protein